MGFRAGISGLSFRPLSPDRWSDLVQLFGARGACGGCWCMWWRIERSQFQLQKGAQNKAAFKTIVDAGEQTGILAYLDSEPVGWCAVAPREAYSGLERSRILKPIDDKPVWSTTCLFVAKPFRRRGVTVELLKAAVHHVRQQGGRIVEGYPVEPAADRVPDAFAWNGLASAFRKAGFKECLRRSDTRPIMRYTIKRSRKS